MLIDIIFAFLIFFACIRGFNKGLIVALFSIIAFIVGLAAALKLSAIVAAKLSTGVSGKWLPVLSFILVFIFVAMLVSAGASIIQKTFELAMLGWVNRIAGMLFFILLYSIIYSIFLFYAVQLRMIKDATVSASIVYPYIQPLGLQIMNKIGTVIPFFKDIFDQLEHFFGKVADKIQH